MAEPTAARLTSMHFYAWKKGLKTGMYYLRTRPRADAIQFTVDQTALAKTKQLDSFVSVNSVITTLPSTIQTEAVGMSCVYRGIGGDSDGTCEMCSA